MQELSSDDGESDYGESDSDEEGSGPEEEATPIEEEVEEISGKVVTGQMVDKWVNTLDKASEQRYHNTCNIAYPSAERQVAQLQQLCFMQPWVSRCPGSSVCVRAGSSLFL